jgi:HAD superfamily hydrolase (TIGR01484 family)
MMPKLVACDLDGTLLRSDHTVSTRTISVLDELQSRNIPFVIVTGRPTR